MMSPSRQGHANRGSLPGRVLPVLLAMVVITPAIVPATPIDAPGRVTKDVTPPERIHYVQPVYPEDARKQGIEGKVVLDLVVGRSGDVESVEVVTSNPAFDEAATEAVLQWRFKPARKDGEPVSVYFTVVVAFRLDGDKK